MVKKGMNFIRRLNRENIIFQSVVVISDIEVMEKDTVSAQNLKSYARQAKKTQAHGVLCKYHYEFYSAVLEEKIFKVLVSKTKIFVFSPFSESCENICR